jgi:hypothetical protein
MHTGARRRGSLLLLLSCAMLTVAAPVDAQGQIVERRIVDRWLDGSMSPAFTLWSEYSWASRVAEPAPPGSPVRFETPNGSGRFVEVWVSPTGAPVSWEISLPDPFPHPSMLRWGTDSLELTHRLLGTREGGRPHPLPVPVWDLLVIPPPGAAAWGDTVDVEAESGPYRLRLRAHRTFRILGDTLVDGLTYPLVAEESRVTLEEDGPDRTHTRPGSTARVLRSATGTLVGRLVVDPVSGVLLARSDTLHLEGTATLELSDGLGWTFPTRYEARREDRRYEAEAWERIREARAARAEDERYGWLDYWHPERQRLREGGSEVLAETMEAWDASRDPEERHRLLFRLQGAPLDIRPPAKELARRALATGDTVEGVRLILQQLNQIPLQPLTVPDLELLLPFLRDPGEAFRLGVAVTPLYDRLAWALLRHAPFMDDGPGEPLCEPEACSLLRRLDAEGAAGAREPDPRVRELALLARFVEDPVAVAEELEALPREESSILEPVYAMVDGIGFTTAASLRAPIPEPGASWEAWLDWMGGLRPEYLAERAAQAIPGSMADRLLERGVRFGVSHRRALRFRELAEGRDFRQEWEESRTTQPSDSAQLVFGYLLANTLEEPPDPHEVVRLLTSDSQTLRTLGGHQLPALFRGPAPSWSREPDDQELVELLEELLGHLLAPPDPEPGSREDPWPYLEAERVAVPLPSLPKDPDSPAFLLSDPLPASFLERWRDRVAVLDQARWDARDPRAPGTLLHLRPPRKAGDHLVQMGFSLYTRRARESHQVPIQDGSAVTIILLRTPEGWRIVSAVRFS